MSKHVFRDKLPSRGRESQKRSMRGASRSETSAERFESALNNIAPEHQKLFRSMWMRFQGSRKKHGREPHEAFYDWLHEHPEALLELEESSQVSDDGLAKAEISARKRSGRSVDAQRVSLSETLAITRDQRREHQEEAQETRTRVQNACKFDINAASQKFAEARVPWKPGEDFCTSEYVDLEKGAARAACNAKTKLARLDRQRTAIQAKKAKAEKAHRCTMDALQQQLQKIDFETKLQKNISEAAQQHKNLSRKKVRFSIF